MLKRFWSVFVARNKEYYRDKAAFGWNFAFPFLIIVGFAAMFQNEGHDIIKFGIIAPETPLSITEKLPVAIADNTMVQVIRINNRKEAFDKLAHHRLDLIVEDRSTPITYWISTTSPKGSMAESILVKALVKPTDLSVSLKKGTVQSLEIRYISWMFPGIIAMSMMFSALYGVGFTIVRYRKNGVLKRLKATPLTAFEYLSAQVISRLFLILISCSIVYAGCALLFGFHCRGSYIDLVLYFMVGSASIISLGLIVSVRTSSEEFANGLLNLISWPMMFLSEVWFSLEGAPEWVRSAAKLFPLSHVTEGMRLIINDGAGIADIRYQFMSLLFMTVVFMFIGSYFFKWVEE
jgi:ABC-2 type transport system permease protein